MATGVGVEVVEEFIAAGIERANEHGGLAARLHQFLAVELDALELRHGRILIAHDELDLLAGRYFNFAWDELVVLDHDHDTRVLRDGWGRQGKHQKSCTEDKTTHRRPHPRTMQMRIT